MFMRFLEGADERLPWLAETNHIRLEHPAKSAVAEQSVDLGHRIQFHNTSILGTKTRYMDRIVREAVEIELHPNKMNTEAVFWRSNSWKPLSPLY
jgi:hypothetical protein